MEIMFKVALLLVACVLAMVWIVWSDRKFEERWRLAEMKELQKHRWWNPVTSRIQIPFDELLRMETRIITLEELEERMTQLDYNGVEHYPSHFPLRKGEVGHDLKWRYRII